MDAICNNTYDAKAKTTKEERGEGGEERGVITQLFLFSPASRSEPVKRIAAKKKMEEKEVVEESIKRYG